MPNRQVGLNLEFEHLASKFIWDKIWQNRNINWNEFFLIRIKKKYPKEHVLFPDSVYGNKTHFLKHNKLSDYKESNNNVRLEQLLTFIGGGITNDLVFQYAHNFNFDALIFLNQLPHSPFFFESPLYSEEFFFQYQEFLPWHGQIRFHKKFSVYEPSQLAMNKELIIPIELLRKYALRYWTRGELVDGSNENTNEDPSDWYCYSLNKHLSLTLIREFKEYLIPPALSKNEHLPWNLELLKIFPLHEFSLEDLKNNKGFQKGIITPLQKLGHI